MPRFLYLMRHAQSAEKQMGHSDIERELTSTGIKQSLQVAGFIKQQNYPLDAIICSKAERASATGSLIAEALKLVPERVIIHEELYEASTRTFYNCVTQLEDNLHHVMCVGHNPPISYLAEYLTKAEIGEMVPAGMCIIKLDVDSWKEVTEGKGDLIRYVTAEMFDH